MANLSLYDLFFLLYRKRLDVVKMEHGKELWSDP